MIWWWSCDHQAHITSQPPAVTWPWFLPASHKQSIGSQLEIECHGYLRCLPNNPCLKIARTSIRIMSVSGAVIAHFITVLLSIGNFDLNGCHNLRTTHTTNNTVPRFYLLFGGGRGISSSLISGRLKVWRPTESVVPEAETTTKKAHFLDPIRW